MAIRKIREDSDPILRKKSRPVTEFDERLFTLLDDMAETMYSVDGVGLGGAGRRFKARCGNGYRRRSY